MRKIFWYPETVSWSCYFSGMQEFRLNLTIFLNVSLKKTEKKKIILWIVIKYKKKIFFSFFFLIHFQLSLWKRRFANLCQSTLGSTRPRRSSTNRITRQFSLRGTLRRKRLLHASCFRATPCSTSTSCRGLRRK